MFLAISEFPKGRKYLISLSFRGKASVRPAQVGGFDVNIVIHGSTAVRGRGDLVAYRWALWKLTAPWTHRTRPPHLGKRCAFSTSSTGPFPSNHSRKTPKGPEIALGNPDRPMFLAAKPCTYGKPHTHGSRDRSRGRGAGERWQREHRGRALRERRRVAGVLRTFLRPADLGRMGLDPHRVSNKVSKITSRHLVPLNRRWCAETSVRRGPGHRDGRRGMIST